MHVSALSIPIAGILLALSSRRSTKGSDVCEEAGPLFAGLQWAYDSKESKRSRHVSEFLPIEVIRVSGFIFFYNAYYLFDDVCMYVCTCRL